MALSQDEFFNQYWGGTAQAGQVQSYASSRVFDGSGWRSPTGGEVARLESSLKNWVRNNPSSGFQAAWASYEGEQQRIAAEAALEAQRQEQARVLAEAQAQVETARKAAGIAAKKAVAVSAQSRSQAQIEQSQLAQAQRQTIQVAKAQQRKAAGATVGQPGRTRTKVSSGLGIGGYGGTAAGRVTSTGLNI